MVKDQSRRGRKEGRKERRDGSEGAGLSSTGHNENNYCELGEIGRLTHVTLGK